MANIDTKDLLLSLFLAVGVLVSQGCADSNAKNFDPQIQSIKRGNIAENSTRVEVTVIDSVTKKPIKGVVVYLGDGAAGRCYSKSNGRCTIKGVAWGDYSLGLFKRGYSRYTQSHHFKKGYNFVNVQLRKKNKVPTLLRLEGSIIKVVSAKGTRSENQYYMIESKNGVQEYLFDSTGANRGFEKFVNKRVVIEGFRGMGFVGWQHMKVKGIYVENIKIK